VPAFERRAEPNANPNTANAITASFFPMISVPSVVSAIEPNNHCEVAQEIDSIKISPKKLL
jgi:hypothetical protein